MGSKLNRIAAVLLAVVAVCSCQALRPHPGPAMGKTIDARPGIGLIEHRGRFYRMEDLMDPAFRAASNERFVKNFGDTHIVRDWAGMNPEDHLKLQRGAVAERRRLLRLEPWAGMNPTDHN